MENIAIEQVIKELDAFIAEYGPTEEAVDRYVAALGQLRIIELHGPGFWEKLMRDAGASEKEIQEDRQRVEKDLGILLSVYEQ